jgi:hypothetical protein
MKTQETTNEQSQRIEEAEKNGMTPYKATGIAEGWIISRNEDTEVQAWQYLHDTGIAYKLQGTFGRIANSLKEAGYIKK